MTPADFFTAVEGALKLQGAAFDRRVLEYFLAAMWPWAEEVPDAGRGAAEIVQAGRATLPA